ncbi:unnamed protein product [Peniophora sp. CBMAI 1063]|nr:unnamed protein product [Peniophora sp. CBMAI 1063]
MRSKGALLHADDEEFVSDGANDPLAELVLSHHGRLSHLRLSSIRRSHDVVKRILSLPFESLEQFTLAVNKASRPLSLRDMSLFGGHSPRLRVLDLMHPLLPFSSVDWTSPAFNTLETLRLSLDATNAHFINLTFLQAIRRMSHLRTLCILELTMHSVVSACDACSHAQHNIVPLDGLETLVLLGSPHNHAHFLRHIRLQPHSRLVMNGAIPHPAVLLPPERMYGELSEALKDVWCHNEVVPPFQAACMYFEETARRGDYLVQLCLSRDITPRTPSPTALPFHGVSDGPASNTLCMYMRDDGAPSIIPAFPIHHVRSLILQGGSFHLSYANLFMFIGIERLHVCPTAARRAYTDILRLLELREDVPLLLPRLRHLSAPDFRLSSALDTFAPGGLSGRSGRAELWQKHGITFYLYVEEEIAFVRDGKIEETSCKGIPEARVLQAIDRLKGVDYVRIVNKDFDLFAAWRHIDQIDNANKKP